MYLNISKLRVVDGPGFNRLWNRLLDELQRNSLSSVQSPLRLSQDSSGLRLDIVVPAASDPVTDTPPFYTYKTSDTTVKVTGGNLLRSAGLPMRTIPDSAELTVADGDYVWIERNTSSYASVPGWDFKNGAAWPTTKLFYRLATIAISSGALAITHLWPGGNLTHQDQFPVLLSSPTGTAGDNANNCAFTYTVKTIDSAVTLFASTTAPKNSRYPLTTYTAGTIGMAYITATGTIEFFVLDEIALIEAIC